jgi:DHA2 family multidrug resistance protein
MLAAFMELLDTSIVNVALPHIAGSLSASTNEATWVLTSYLISNAIVLPASAWFGRVFGRKRFLLACVAVFTGASAFCGVAQSLGFLVVARVLQGLGGGALQPISQAVLLESFPPAQYGSAMAFFGVGVVTAPIIGPTLGGWLTDTYSWRWSFYINLPIGLVAMVMIQAFLEDPPYLRREGRPRVDYVGFGLMALALGTLQVVLDKGEEADWFAATWICVASAVCVVAFVAFIICELRVQQPIVDLRVFRNRSFAVGTAMMTALGVVLYSTTVMLPLYLQTLVSYPALQSGLALSPRGFGSIAAMLIAGPLVARVDARLLIGMGLLVLGQSCFYFGGLTLQISIGHVIAPAILNGVGIGLIFVPLATTTMAALPKEAMGNATGIFNLMRNIGGSVGIALITTFIARDAQRHQALLVGNLTPFAPVYQQWLAGSQTALAARGAIRPAEQALAVIYGTLLQQSLFAAFIDNFRLLAFLSLACIPTVFFLRRVRASVPTVMH